MINITYKISSWFYKEQVVKEVLNINLFFIKSWGKERKQSYPCFIVTMTNTEIYKENYFHYTFRYIHL